MSTEIPAWLPYSVLRLPLAANRIINYICINGVHTTVNGQHVIGAQISYKQFARECHLSQSSIASGIRTAVNSSLVFSSKQRNKAAWYAIPVYLPGMEKFM